MSNCAPHAPWIGVRNWFAVSGDELLLPIARQLAPASGETSFSVDDHARERFSLRARRIPRSAVNPAAEAFGDFFISQSLAGAARAGMPTHTNPYEVISS